MKSLLNDHVMFSSSKKTRLVHDVIVKEPPRLTVYPEATTMTVTEGGTLRLDCHLDNSPGDNDYFFSILKNLKLIIRTAP